MEKHGFTIAILLLADITIAAAAKGAGKDAYLFPWEFPGVTPEDRATSQPYTAEISQTLQQLLRNPLPLEGDNLPQNLARKAREILRGEAIQGSEGIAYQPFLCPFYEHYLVSLSTLDMETGIVIDTEFLPIKRAQWLSQKEDAAAWAKQLMGVVATPLPRKNTLQVKLSNGHPLTRKDQTHGSCLNALLGKNLKHSLLMGIGTSAWETTQRALGKRPKRWRATRQLTLRWKRNQKKDNEIRFLLGAKPAEAVFARSIPQKLEGIFSVKIEDLDLKTQAPQDLIDFLRQEEKNLIASEDPKLVRINGSWIYLDRGRAWGLKMRDRLLVGDDPSIRGHVVAFYGPQEGIQDDNGALIHEGAIIYVREGRNKTRKGQRWTFDPKKFPAPLPSE